MKGARFNLKISRQFFNSSLREKLHMPEVKHLAVSATVEVPLTPTRVKSKFKTLHDWLINISQGIKPTTSISAFNISLSCTPSSNEFKVCLYGVDIKFDENHLPHTFIVFEPSNMYVKFPKKEFGKFTYQQIQAKLTMLLKQFT